MSAPYGVDRSCADDAPENREDPEHGRIWPAYAVLITACFFGAYFVLRYQGLWVDSDTSVDTNAISGVQHFARIHFGGAYPNGYGYPTWGAIASSLTGIQVSDLVTLYLPLVGCILLGAMALALYRTILGSQRLAAFAALTLFLVPELYFTVSRGTHEKLTVSLVLLATVAVVNSYLHYRKRGQWSKFATWVVVYYFCAFSLSSLNVFLGSTLTVSLSLFLLLIWLVPQSRERVGLEVDAVRGAPRLTLLVATSWLTVVLVSLFVYPRAGEAIAVLHTAVDRLAALLLSFTPKSNPYVAPIQQWVNRPTYYLLSSFRWVMFLGSFAVGTLLSLAVLRRREPVPIARIIYLALYWAFGLQVALAIPIDLVALPQGSNLEVRTYTYFALFSAPVFVLGLQNLVRYMMRRVRPVLIVGILSALALGFGVLSLRKATLDPQVSKRWIFYSSSEVAAMRFWVTHRQRGVLQLDRQGRLYAAYYLRYPVRTYSANLLRDSGRLSGEFHLVSPITTAHAHVAGDNSLTTSQPSDLLYSSGDTFLVEDAGLPRGNP